MSSDTAATAVPTSMSPDHRGPVGLPHAGPHGGAEQVEGESSPDHQLPVGQYLAAVCREVTAQLWRRMSSAYSRRSQASRRITVVSPYIAASRESCRRECPSAQPGETLTQRPVDTACRGDEDGGLDILEGEGVHDRDIRRTPGAGRGDRRRSAGGATRFRFGRGRGQGATARQADHRDDAEPLPGGGYQPARPCRAGRTGSGQVPDRDRDRAGQLDARARGRSSTRPTSRSAPGCWPTRLSPTSRT